MRTPTLWLLPLVSLAALVGPAPVAARRAAPSRVAELSLDVVGPRSASSVRSALRAREAELAPCQREQSALVRVALAIAPDGSILSARAIDDPGLDADATACVVEVASAWRLTARAGGVTTVAWSFRLAAAEEDARVVCWCFSWVHGPDHGRDCLPASAACKEARRARGPSGDTTPCARSRQPRCEREGYVGGARVRLP